MQAYAFVRIFIHKHEYKKSEDTLSLVQVGTSDSLL